MRSNFDMFAERGDPWVSHKTWWDEMKLATNPKASTRAHNSARDFVEPHAKRAQLARPKPTHVDEPRPVAARSDIELKRKQLANLKALYRHADKVLAEERPVVDDQPRPKRYVWVGKDTPRRA